MTKRQREIDQLIEDVTIDCYNDDELGTGTDLVAILQAYRHWCRR